MLGKVTWYPKDPNRNGIVEDLERFETLKDASFFQKRLARKTKKT